MVRTTRASLLWMSLLGALTLVSGCSGKDHNAQKGTGASDQAAPTPSPTSSTAPMNSGVPSSSSGAANVSAASTGPSTVATAPAPAAPAAGSASGGAAIDAQAAMKQSDCFSCHAVDKKLVGPAYSWVADRYKGDSNAASKLAMSIKTGGAGKWNAYTNGVPMTPHPQLSDAQLKAMAEWVLSQTPVPPPPTGGPAAPGAQGSG